MWNVKAKVIPVIIGASGTISKLDNTRVTCQGSKKLRKYTKQSSWTLLTY